MIKPHLASLALLLSSLAVPAAWAVDVGARVHEVDATPIDERPVTEQERIYPLGALRKISGQLRMESQINARGQVSSVTYELPPERNAKEAFAAARQSLQTPGTQLLFLCEARECGESSLWANEIFSNAKLLGADDQQRFFLLRLASPDADTLLAVYSVTRTNRLVSMHVEQFTADAPLGEVLPNPATVLNELRTTGMLDYPALASAPAAPWVTLLSRALNLDSSLRVTLAGQGAAAWQTALVAAGVRESRLQLGTLEQPGLHITLIR